MILIPLLYWLNGIYGTSNKYYWIQQPWCYCGTMFKNPWWYHGTFLKWKPYILALYLLEHSLISVQVSGYVYILVILLQHVHLFFQWCHITNLPPCDCGIHIAPLTGSRCVFHHITHTLMRAQWSSRCVISPGLPPTYAHSLHTLLP